MDKSKMNIQEQIDKRRISALKYKQQNNINQNNHQSIKIRITTNNKMQSSLNEIKQAIRELPIQQRAVAIALKNIFDQVKQLTKKEQQQIDANHLGFIGRFKLLEQRASDIVLGKNLLTPHDLDNSTEFFTPDEQPQTAKLMQSKLPIEDYWYRAIANSEHGDSLTQQEQTILKALTDIQTNITTNQISLTIIFKQNPYLSQGTFIRTLVLDNGMPVKFVGDEPKWISKETKMDGVIVGLLLNNTEDQDRLTNVFALVGSFVNELVPYSLEYYLGAVGDDEDDEEDDDQEEDEEGDDGEDE